MKSGVKNKDSRVENSKNLSDILYSIIYIYINILTRLTFLSLLSKSLADSMEALALMPLSLLYHKFLVEF